MAAPFAFRLLSFVCQFDLGMYQASKKRLSLTLRQTLR
jgi:hypothetical protein